MQSNINRLRNILKKGKVLFIISGIAIVILNKTNLDEILTFVGVFWSIVGFLWWSFDNYLWKIKFINRMLRFSPNFYCPVIEGRWSGTLTREDVDHDFVIEIKQTYTTVSCEGYTKHSHSKSLCSELLYDEQNNCYSFIFLWQGKTSVDVNGNKNPSNYFTGTSILKVSESCNKLQGSYFTNRSPRQTKGDILLDKRQKELKNAFENI